MNLGFEPPIFFAQAVKYEAYTNCSSTFPGSFFWQYFLLLDKPEDIKTPRREYAFEIFW